MDPTIYKELEIPEDNGHLWIEIIQPTHSFYKKMICKKCGYFRRVSNDGNTLNNPCKGPIRIALR